MSRISFRLQSLKSNSHRQSLILLAVLLAACALLVRSSGSNSATPPKESSSTQGKKRPPGGCPSCPPPSPRRIYAPAIELREAERCEIVLNSRSANPVDVTPIFYTLNGNAVVGNPLTLQPAEIRFVPVEELMPDSLRGQHRWGGIVLSYTGNVLEFWAQITFHGVGGGSFDETFNILEEPGSDTREAVWLMPKKSTAVIALGNSSNTPIRTTAQFSDGDSEDVDIPEGATKFIAAIHGNATLNQSGLRLLDRTVLCVLPASLSPMTTALRAASASMIRRRLSNPIFMPRISG